MASRSDSFNRADNATSMGTPSDAGSAWVKQGTDDWGISSNAGYCVGAGVNNFVTLQASAANIEVQVTLSTGPGGTAAAGVCARLTDNNNAIVLYWDNSNGDLVLERLQTGTYTGLGAYATTMVAGDVIRLVVNGDQVSGYLNGTLRIGPVTETFNQAVTEHGLFSYNSSAARYDDFSITDIGGGGAGTGHHNYRRLLAMMN